jgi:AraC-like DNA-binding protein
MTKAPPNFAVPSGRGLEGHSSDIDALSEILATLQLHGEEAFLSASPDQPTQQFGAGTRVLHLVKAGTLHINVSRTGATISLLAGDMVLLARGDAHAVSGDVGAVWVTGTFRVDAVVAEPLLSVLPEAIVIGGDMPNSEWLPLSLDLLIAEIAEQRPGNHVMVSRILDLLFIHALRVWARDSGGSPGWLTVAMDTRLGAVVSAIRRDPSGDWSVDRLAQMAGYSRSAFASRFGRLVGKSPAAFVTEQRLNRASTLLTSTTEPVGQVAHLVGYTSEAAFSRAFQRYFGAPPRTWRTQARRPT